jgi:hypothetical protein
MPITKEVSETPVSAPAAMNRKSVHWSHRREAQSHKVACAGKHVIAAMIK